MADILKSSSLISCIAVCRELSTTSPHTTELLVAINIAESFLIALVVDPVSKAINRDKTIRDLGQKSTQVIGKSIFRYDTLF